MNKTKSKKKINAPALQQAAEENVPDDGNDGDVQDESEESGNAAPRQAQSSKAGKRKAATAAAEEAHQKRLKAMKLLYKPPTVEEINRLKETENYYHSNLFRMQTEEMLKEVAKDKEERFIKSWLYKFYDAMNNISIAKAPRSLVDLEYETITFPIDLPSESAEQHLAKQEFKFMQHSMLHMIGTSFRLASSYGNKPRTVKLVVVMPEECCRKEDYLNMRYHLKRAHYLCTVADELNRNNDNQLFSGLKFEYSNQDTLKPVLVLTPSDVKMARKVSFHLYAIMTRYVFSAKRFSPEQNNVRPVMIDEREAATENELTATPHYNSSILYDMNVQSNSYLLDEILEMASIREAAILLKIWCHQRGFDQGHYSFDSDLVTFYLGYLLHTKRIYATMSSYQIIRLFWNQLANSKWDTEGITLDPNAKDALLHFLEHFDTVFLDYTGALNLTANLSVELYRRMRLESAAAIQLLNNLKINSFHALFLRKYPTYTQYDHIVVNKEPQQIQGTIEAFAEKADQLNFIGAPIALFSRMLVKLLRRGLGARATLIVPMVTNDLASLAIGILLDPTESFVLVDKGPEAIDAVASDEFRTFWQGKSELRRFKDGAITESCVWGESTDPIGKKRLITQEIVRYLLYVHFDIPRKMVMYAAEQFERSIVPLPTLDRSEHETIEERTLACIHAFDGLSRLMRDLDDLPLTIHAILGTDAVFRYSDPDPPRPTATGLLVDGQLMLLSGKVMHATIQLEASGKWPEHLEAIRRLKAAFYLQIVNSLEAKCQKLHGGKPRAQAYADYLDVLHEKYVFRFRIIHQREISIVREQLAQNKVTKLYRDSDESVALELQATILPKLTSILHGLHQQYFSFGSVVSIAKRWLYAQLIDPFLWPDECTELLVASLYLRQTPLIQPQAGFLRFLHYLATTDWSKELILLNFNDEMPDEVLDVIDQRFLHKRDTFPPLAIVTSCDNEKYGLFCKHGPSVHVLNRVSLLAQIAVAMLDEDFSSIRKIGKRFFTACYVGYDLIIHLNDKVIPSIGLRKPVDMDNRQHSVRMIADKEKEPAAGFYPVQFYLRELREAYDQYAMFFYDPCGGDRIAVLWRPDELKPKPFTTSNVNGRHLTEDGTLLMDRETLIRDFKILGKDVVVRIERNG